MSTTMSNDPTPAPVPAGVIETSRGEYFILDLEDPRIPREYLDNAPKQKRCPAFKVIGTRARGTRTEHTFVCDLDPGHDGMHKQAKPFTAFPRVNGKPAVIGWRVIAKWID